MKAIDIRNRLMRTPFNILMDPGREEFEEIRSGANMIEGRVTFAIYNQVIWPIIRRIEDER